MDLGAAIHRRGGMDSCQSVADNISSSGTSDYISSSDSSSLQDSLTTSMVSIPMVPTDAPKKYRFSFHNSFDNNLFRRDT